MAYTSSRTVPRFVSIFNFEHVHSEFSQIGSCLSEDLFLGLLSLLISGQYFSKGVLTALLSNYVEYSAFCNLKLPELLLLIFAL